jgi:hypothetical protein
MVILSSSVCYYCQMGSLICWTSSKVKNTITTHLSSLLLEGSGTNLEGSTALGMTCTIDGGRCARKMKLSRHV